MEFKSILARSSEIPWRISRVLKDYCEGYAKLDRTSCKGEIYLIESCKIGEIARVSFALYLGFDVHANDDYAFRCAAYYGHAETCATLFNHGADVVHAFYNQAFRRAARKGYTDVCKLLLDHGVNVRGCNDYALRWAAHNGHADVCALLLDRGADVHACHDCALRYAAGNGRVSVCKLLLDRGADVHANDDGALKEAAAHGHADVCILLLDHGADVYYALRLAAYYGREYVCNLLKKYMNK